MKSANADDMIANESFISRLKRFITEEMNQQLALHGGRVDFLDYDAHRKAVHVELSGGCKGCAMAQVTLKSGIEAALKAEFPEVESVVDKTIHEPNEFSYY